MKKPFRQAETVSISLPWFTFSGGYRDGKIRMATALQPALP